MPLWLLRSWFKKTCPLHIDGAGVLHGVTCPLLWFTVVAAVGAVGSGKRRRRMPRRFPRRLHRRLFHGSVRLTLSAYVSPGYCAAFLRCTLYARPRSCAAHRTGSETSSPPNTLPAADHGSFPPAHSASAFPAECVPTRSAAPHTMPESAGSSAPARCRNEPPAALHARPQSAPAPASLSGWQNSYPLPGPDTPACRHPPRSAPPIARPHPTASCAKSKAHSWFAAVRATGASPPARNACTSSAGSSVPPRDKSDAVSCGSLALHFAAAAPAGGDIRNAASLAITPLTSCATKLLYGLTPVSRV